MRVIPLTDKFPFNQAKTRVTALKLLPKVCLESLESHFQTLILQHVPENLRAFDPNKMSVKPNLDSYVFLKVKETTPGVLIEDGKEARSSWVPQTKYLGIKARMADGRKAPGVEHIQKDPGHPCCSTPGFNFLSVVGRQGDDLAGVRRAENRLAKHCRQIILVGVLQKLPADQLICKTMGMIFLLVWTIPRALVCQTCRYRKGQGGIPIVSVHLVSLVKQIFLLHQVDDGLHAILVILPHADVDTTNILCLWTVRQAELVDLEPPPWLLAWVILEAHKLSSHPWSQSS
ncbi:putative DNA replication complex GINS protein SLD5-like [Penaeus vannamei]|uniref:Putative DNA replication complex GINS protein SLD5-like n=1 Tax=Penaeus vannamei TaxID=6689 RepID=A0A423SQ90_PENVA|nr:putative DNA replication complex GINS protein SLD5-like [Penaeus vannamei]